MGEVDGEAMYMWSKGYMGISVLPSQFCYEPKTALKIVLINVLILKSYKNLNKEYKRLLRNLFSSSEATTLICIRAKD